MGYTPQEKRILDAALNVIAKHSISGTRMHLIADEAGMVPSNLHYHFKTKRDLLLALLSDLQDTFYQKRNDAIAQSCDTLHTRMAAFFQQKKELILNCPQYDQAQFDFWVLGQSDEEINTLFRPSLDQWRAHLTASILEFCPHAEPEFASLVAHTMVSMMMGGSMQYLNNRTFDLDAYFALCLEYVLSSIDRHAPATESPEGASS